MLYRLIITLILTSSHVSALGINRYINENGYTLDIPALFDKWSTISDNLNDPGHPYFYVSSKQANELRSTSIKVYHNQQLPCSYKTLGTPDNPTTHPNSQIRDLSTEDATILWSKVPVVGVHAGYPDAYCNNYPPDCSGTDYFDGTCKTEYATYAFCAEKDARRVVICMNQNKDNPELAKQVFESFRWVDTTSIFSDVTFEHQFGPAMYFVKEKGIVQGYPDGTYKPDSTINRAEFTKILIGAKKIQEKENGEEQPYYKDWCDVTLTDIVTSAWYYTYVQTAFCNDIISGYPDKTFRPADNINTAEAAKILVNTFDLPLPPGLPSDPWYTSYIAALSNAEALPSTATNPSHLLTRGEMAEMIYRVQSR